MNSPQARQQRIRSQGDDDKRHTQTERVHQQQPRADSGAALFCGKRQNGSENRTNTRRPAERKRQAQNERAQRTAHANLPEVRAFLPVQERDIEHTRKVKAKCDNHQAQRDSDIRVAERLPQSARTRAERHEYAADAQHEGDDIRATAHGREFVRIRIGRENACIHRQKRHNARREKREQAGKSGRRDKTYIHSSPFDITPGIVSSAQFDL